MTDPMELVGRLEGHEARYRRSATIASNRVGRDPSQRSHVTLNNRRADDMAEAAACIREMVGFVPPISLDGPNLPDEHRIWLARQLLDSKLTDAEAYSIVRHHPGIKDTTHDR